jgi:hypothetical protein
MAGSQGAGAPVPARVVVVFLIVLDVLNVFGRKKRLIFQRLAGVGQRKSGCRSEKKRV